MMERCGPKVVVMLPAHRRRLALRAPLRGTTVVELLVVMLIVAVVSVSLCGAIGAALGLEQSLREEVAARERLCLELGVIADRLALAKDVRPVGLTNEVSYPLETGGICFETNSVIRVSSVGLAAGGGNLRYTRVADDPRKPASLTLESVLLEEAAPAAIELTRVEIVGLGDVRRVRLTARVPLNDRGRIKWRTIRVERPVRLWNRETAGH